MAINKEKMTGLEKELERRIVKYRNPFINAEPFQEYCEKIKKHAQDGCDDFSFIDFVEREQYLPSGVHQLTGEAVVMINRVYADHFWFQSSAEEVLDAEAFIGMINDPVTNLPKLRAFWRCKHEETGEEHFNELESFYMVAIAEHNSDTNNDKVENGTGNYALVSGFISGEMFELGFYEVPSISIVKTFIAEISAALNVNPTKRSIDMPKKEVFMELISKLTIIGKTARFSLTYRNGRNNRKYDRQFKIEAAKQAIKDPLSIRQVAKKLNIPHMNLYNWVRDYERLGENAFLGSKKRQLYKNDESMNNL